ncbi:unnamed protein product [Brassica napus]|uniref:Uncharacterized protein n=2 Tax=Brassica TaxID=3705 RepID=A0A3P6B2V2_BRACM|nr:unnamed protein product [Brassica napus]VDC99332.1 unnamed protein product [Brassica rapa]
MLVITSLVKPHTPIAVMRRWSYGEPRQNSGWRTTRSKKVMPRC